VNFNDCVYNSTVVGSSFYTELFSYLNSALHNNIKQILPKSMFIYLFIVYLTTLSETYIIDRQMIGLLMCNELERMWNNTILAYF
jgi:hypothetical protein